jgi:hypothetical protein
MAQQEHICMPQMGMQRNERKAIEEGRMNGVKAVERSLVSWILLRRRGGWRARTNHFHTSNGIFRVRRLVTTCEISSSQGPFAQRCAPCLTVKMFKPSSPLFSGLLWYGYLFALPGIARQCPNSIGTSWAQTAEKRYLFTTESSLTLPPV